MVVGGDDWGVGGRVHGIEIVEKVTILGIVIDRKLEDLNANWDNSITKMQWLALYWRTFGLSITGRVMVAKTYILSQCIYLMGSLPMSVEIGNRINEVLMNFVKGTDRLIERRRQGLCQALGGYGIMDVNTLNVCMKASWVERWKRELPERDYIAATVWNQQDGYEAWKVDCRNIRGKGLWIMEDIIIAWNKFRINFYEWGNNINVAEAFGNSALFEDGETMEEKVFMGGRQNMMRGALSGKKIRDVCNLEGSILDKVLVEQRLGVTLSWVEYFRMRTEINGLTQRFPRKTVGVCTEQNIEEFTTGKKRGCKRYRRIMEGRHSKQYALNTPMTIPSAITLWGDYVENMGRDLVEANFKLWSCAPLDSVYKNFLFKYVHGKLYLNSQLAHFADVTRACTFCKIQEEKAMRSENVVQNSLEYTRRIVNLNRETVSHLLWECRWVNTIIQRMLRELLGENRLVDKNKFMGGWGMESGKAQEVILIVIHYMKFVIYVCRNRRVIPTLTHMRYELGELLGMMSK
jgi:hypothetical protein